jgi:cytoskeleton protein RodZ
MTNYDPNGSAQVADVLAANAASWVSAGALLRQARENSGLHIGSLAVTMKVPVKKLEALEAGRLDLLPDAVFARALASSVCRTLKIDATPILEHLPHTKKVSLTVESRAANEPFNASGHSNFNSSPMSMAKTAMFIALALMVGVALLLWIPSSNKEAPATAATGPTSTQTAPPSSTVEEVQIPWSNPLPAAVTAESPPVAPLEQPTTVVPAPPSAPIPVMPSVAPPAVTTVSPVATNSPVVVFKARGESWVEVIDAKGVVQIRKNVLANESVGVAGLLPMVVVVGRADMTEVLVRGQPFDLRAVTVGNVARFEVK